MFDSAFPQENPLNLKTFAGASATILKPAPMGAQFSLRIAPRDLQRAVNAFGAPLPKKIGQTTQNGQTWALCLGPDEWQLRFSHDLANALVKNFAHLQASTPHSFVDISHRHIGIELSGPFAARLINSGSPLNLNDLAVGMCARTIFDKVQMGVLRLGEAQYHLEFFRSFSPFAWQYLENAARQFEAEMQTQ